MYSKNIILFFCMATSFLHCQGAPPTEEQLEMIRNIVKIYKKTTRIDFKDVKNIIKEVAEKTGVFKEFPRLDELQLTASNCKFTMDEVERIVHEFVVFQDPDLTELTRNRTKKYKRPDGINFDGVKGVIKELADIISIPKEFPSLDELRTTASNRKFTTDEVERIAKEFIVFQDPILKETVKELFEKHEKPDGIDIKELKYLIKDAVVETGITAPLPSVDELKTAISNRKFTAEEVETIVKDYLF